MKKFALTTAVVALLASPLLAHAHSPLFDCFDNGDGSVSCQGGFSDGSSASGVKITVKDAKGTVLETLALDANSECSFKKPNKDYTVSFDAGEGHSIVVNGSTIVE